MDKVAQLSAAERRELFQETATQRGLSPVVIEKDFWVCWVLKQLFADPDLGTQLVFKGGTSRAKVYHLIDRFSEDVDLILDWRVLGYGPGQEDPYQEFASNAQQDRFNKKFNQRAAQYIADTLIHNLNRLLSWLTDVTATIDTKDPHTINVTYLAAFAEEYLRPEVRLEIGPLAAWVPSGRHTIRPYAAESFPAVFDESTCPVTAIRAERSFWEKATILHQQVHRTTPMSSRYSRYSRHYYDLHKLATNPARKAPLNDMKLLQEVASFKQRFYPSAWASYETARAGSLRLIPGAQHLVALRKDYGDMRMMISGEAPAFDLIMDSIQDLEDEINR
jgi:hypothetical protein